MLKIVILVIVEEKKTPPGDKEMFGEINGIFSR